MAKPFRRRCKVILILIMVVIVLLLITASKDQSITVALTRWTFNALSSKSKQSLKPLYEEHLPGVASDWSDFTDDPVYGVRPHEQRFQTAFRVNGTILMKMYVANPFKVLLDDRFSSEESTKQRVLILTACVGEERQAFCNITVARMHEYASLHNYDIEVHRTFRLDEGLDARWLKMKIILHWLENATIFSKYDYTAFLDDDIYILNLNFRITRFFDLGTSSTQLIFSRDSESLDPFRFINDGIMLFKVTNETLSYFRRVWSLKQELPYFKTGSWHEQSMALLAIYEMFSDRTLVLPTCILQCFWTFLSESFLWDRRCFVLHVLYSNYKDRLFMFQTVQETDLPTLDSKMSAQANVQCFNEFDVN